MKPTPTPHMWWYTLKSAVFGSSSSLPPFVGGRVDRWASRLVRLICCQIILMASSPENLLDLLLTCHTYPRLTTFAFRSGEVRHLLLDLDPYGGTDPLDMFSLFLKRTTDVLAPVLEKCFGGLFDWVVSLLSGDRPMSLQFRKVHRPPLLPITD